MEPWWKAEGQGGVLKINILADKSTLVSYSDPNKGKEGNAAEAASSLQDGRRVLFCADDVSWRCKFERAAISRKDPPHHS